ncbi:WXG100 family type VII secretion target [Fictibacillus sp. FJAT-27399]|uniref:WXG100 family type VII secretion target n=1 Tax=Fictibacillus sp. FJAT-27399 TaxID=1729689 RepID=UPI000783DFCB|nr:WXG100 family type VII secretion target [Fictibacillus sp. FJAT-27399]
MDSGKIREMAQAYSQAAGLVRECESRLKGTLEFNGGTWTGNRKEKFNSKYQDATKAFNSVVTEFMETSSELNKAALRCEQILHDLLEKERLQQLKLLELQKGGPR